MWIDCTSPKDIKAANDDLLLHHLLLQLKKLYSLIFFQLNDDEQQILQATSEWGCGLASDFDLLKI